MKLCRIGELGKEKPAVIDKDNNYKDLSSIINDFDSKTLTFETLEKIKNTDISKLPILKSNERIGA
jgi:2,4-diketo-3-deoxy-L-fuconate hydrolase